MTERRDSARRDQRCGGSPRRHRRRHRHGRRDCRGRRVHRLHRKLFWWFGASILLSGAVVGGVLSLTTTDGRWRQDMRRLEAYLGNRAADAWRDPTTRAAFADALAVDLDAGVTLSGAGGETLYRAGAACERVEYRVRVPAASRGPTLGEVALCRAHHRGPRGWVIALALFTSCACLWLASGLISRRLLRPLREIARVAGEIGDGRLDARARVPSHRAAEMAVLAHAINDMAERIQKQLADQRALLAAVSHEIRTPLGHMRVLVELCRDGDAPGDNLDALEREILHVDGLVGQLLASSRLEFDAVVGRALDARDAAVRAVERAGLDPAMIRVEAADTSLWGDPTLIARALANLLDNARVHGGGATAVIVGERAGAIAFEVCDEGPGIPADERARVFEMFQRGPARDTPAPRATDEPSLGLGLALVRRIAEAHGGEVWVADTADGARIGFSLARGPADEGDEIHDPSAP